MRKKTISDCFLFGVLTIGLTACDTASVRPLMEEFTSSVGQASNQAERAFGSSDLDGQLDNLRRNVMAGQNSAYALEERCRPLEPTVVEIDQPPKDFDEYCRIAAKVFDPATQQLADAKVVLPEGDPVVEAANARRLMRGLADYAEALEEMLLSDSPARTSAQAVAALEAIGDLSEAATEKRRGDSGLLSDKGKTLVARATSEALEAYRYRALKQVVTKADPAVQNAALIVAVWFNREIDRGNVAAAYAELEAAVDEAGIGNAADLHRVERAYDAAQAAEEGAGWRVFWNIAVAHAAIRDSFARSTSSEALDEANSRILDLAESVRAFLKRRK